MKNNEQDRMAATENLAFWITGRNPVLEALKAGLKATRLLLRGGARGAQLDRIRRQAERRQIPVEVLSESQMHRILREGDHRGVGLQLELPPPVEWDTFYEAHLLAGKKPEELCLVLLDGVQDPHNMGAILRTALAAGVSAVILPDKGSAPLGATVFRTSAGALAWQTIVRVPDSAWILDELGRRGIRRLGLDAGLGTPLASEAADLPVCLVLGSEGRGLARRVQERLDGFLSIPVRGRVDSLNVSVAAGIVIYHWLGHEIPADIGEQE